MPGILTTVVGADIKPFARELNTLQAMSARTGAIVRKNLDSGGSGHINSGWMRETAVLLREMSRGNWSRVPGSFTILISQLMGMKILSRDAATATEILAQAYEKEAAKASLAALAATRKAAASKLANTFTQDGITWTLKAAVADEEAAAAARIDAAAMEAKAIAARQAATATEANTVATAGSFGVMGAGLLAVGLIALTVYETFWGLKRAMAGMDIPALKLDYIAKVLRSTNQTAEAQKKITDEINKSVEAYNSAAEAAKRVSDATGKHFEHLRKMNEFEKNPARRAARELQIDHDERKQRLADMRVAQANFNTEARTKYSQAAGIKVHTEAEDQEIKKGLDQNAEAAQIYLDKLKNGDTWDNIQRNAAIKFGGSPLKMGERQRAVEAAMDMNEDAANAAIAERDRFADTYERNKALRGKKSTLETDAAKAAGKASDLALQIPDTEKSNAQADREAFEEAIAKATESKGGITRGTVNDLQKVGAYVAPASTANSISPDAKAIVAALKEVYRDEKRDYEKMEGRKTFQGVVH